MNNSVFKPEKFFNLSNFDFKDIFDNTNFVWEVLPSIGEYINSLFQKKFLLVIIEIRRMYLLARDLLFKKG